MMNCSYLPEDAQVLGALATMSSTYLRQQRNGDKNARQKPDDIHHVVVVNVSGGGVHAA